MGLPRQKKFSLFYGQKEIGNLVYAADIVFPVKIDIPLSDEPHQRHKRHMQYAPYFKTEPLYLKPVHAHLTGDTDLILKMTPRVVFKHEDKQAKTKVCHSG